MVHTADTGWSIRSKRFLFTLIVAAVWIATFVVSAVRKDYEVFRFATPWCLAFIAAYNGFESWRPSGLAERITGMLGEQTRSS